MKRSIRLFRWYPCFICSNRSLDSDVDALLRKCRIIMRRTAFPNTTSHKFL
jgi:hypothetical protein